MAIQFYDTRYCHRNDKKNPIVTAKDFTGKCLSPFLLQTLQVRKVRVLQIVKTNLSHSSLPQQLMLLDGMLLCYTPICNRQIVLMRTKYRTLAVSEEVNFRKNAKLEKASEVAMV